MSKSHFTEVAKRVNENYLKAIYLLSKTNKQVRAVDVAKYCNRSKASVSTMLQKLKKLAYLQVDKAGYLTLTPLGKAKAVEVYNKGEFFKQLLVKSGVDAQRAEEDANRIAHAISQDSLVKLKALIK